MRKDLRFAGFIDSETQQEQNLRIKSFPGLSGSSAMTQIWAAMCYYLLLLYIKHKTKHSYSLPGLSGVFTETVLERINPVDLLSCRTLQYLLGEST